MIVVETPLLQLRQGHALTELREMAAESVDCVVTSPPYWGLRAYSTDPVIWPHPEIALCDQELRPREHEWTRPTKGRVSGGGDRPPDNKSSKGLGSVDSPSVRHTCARCGAWRGELGLEPTPEMYVQHIVEIFREVKRVLRKRGTLWLNLGDTYAARPAQGSERGSDTMLVDRQKQIPRGTGRWGGGQRWAPGVKPKDLVGIPWRVAFALQADGWYLRSDVIWAKPNPMPESVVDRPTRSHEYIFLLTKSRRYFYDADAIREEFQSSPSDLRKMIEAQERIAGNTKTREDPLLAASAHTNVGQKRGVGDAYAAAVALDSRTRTPAGWDTQKDGNGHRALVGRYKTADDPAALFTRRRQPPEPGEANAIHPLGRNARSVWEIATQPYPSAHFATFPEELPRRAILAGSSTGGSCIACHTPLERVVERGNSEHHCRPGCNHDPDQETWGTAGWSGATAAYGGFLPTARSSDTWARRCTHVGGLDVPAVVLDPFAGSGTVLAVANMLGRRSVGIELSASYVELIRQRCAAIRMQDFVEGKPMRQREDERRQELDTTKGHASLFDSPPPVVADTGADTSRVDNSRPAE